jgi:hypothetical protein
LLKRLFEEQGVGVLDDPLRFRGVLNDYARNGFVRERRLVMQAVEMGGARAVVEAGARGAAKLGDGVKAGDAVKAVSAVKIVDGVKAGDAVTPVGDVGAGCVEGLLRGVRARVVDGLFEEYFIDRERAGKMMDDLIAAISGVELGPGFDTVTSLVYGNGGWAAVVSRCGRDYADRRVAGEGFDGIAGEIKKGWDEGYYVSGVTFGEGRWVCVMKKGLRYTKQRWNTNASFPEREIRTAWEEGFDITGIAYGDGLWALIASRGTGFSTQGYRTSRAFPVGQIEKAWGEGFDITKMCYGDEFWVAVVSKGTGFSAQGYKTGEAFPSEQIARARDDGFFVTDMAYGGGLWVAVVSKGIDCERQQTRISPRFPEKDAAGLWMR